MSLPNFGTAQRLGDDDESDMICRANSRLGDRECGGFWGWLEVSARSAACRNPGRNLRELCPLERPSDAPAGGAFGGSRDHCAG
jgi:hypothetical protein